MEEKHSRLMSINIRKVTLAERNQIAALMCYFLYYEGYKGNMKEHSLERIRKTPHLIVLTVNEQHTELLRKYLPEEWHKYLDCPIKK